MSDVVGKTAPPGLVTLTDKALLEIGRLYESESAKNPDAQGLRLGVKGGGCSGLSYKLAFDQPTENDYILDANGIRVFIDPKSAIYLKGIQVDYQDGLEGRGFVFINPNATNTCGCGESFSV